MFEESKFEEDKMVEGKVICAVNRTFGKINFYEVIRRTPKMVTLRLLKKKSIPTETPGYYELVFTNEVDTSEPVIRRKIYLDGNRVWLDEYTYGDVWAHYPYHLNKEAELD